jgi:CRP/FNR family transcriptional regulator
MKTESLIKQCQLFSELNAEAVKSLAKAAQKRDFVKGSILFGEGEEAEALYILVSGAVDLVKSSPEGKEQLVRNVKPGEVFAEAAMFAGDSYPVTAISRISAGCLIITKDRFVKLVRQHPEISMTIIGTMAKLLRHLNKVISDLSLGSVSTRLATYLLKRSKECGSTTVKLDISKRELAFQLGTVPETLSRNLKKMREDGLIETRGKLIILRDIKMLSRLSTESGSTLEM